MSNPTPQPDPKALASELQRYRDALTKINAIRNSIIGCQRVNFSEHVYPLVAALGEAGFEGEEYESARDNVGTLIERANHADFVLSVMAACAERSVGRQEHTEYWYAVRLEKLKDIAKREGIWDEVSAVIANGDGTRRLADGSWVHEPPTYAQQLNRAVHRAQSAKALTLSQAKEIEGLKELARRVDLLWRALSHPASGDLQNYEALEDIATLARAALSSSPDLVEGDQGSSVAESGGTALPKSDSEGGH